MTVVCSKRNVQSPSSPGYVIPSHVTPAQLPHYDMLQLRHNAHLHTHQRAADDAAADVDADVASGNESVTAETPGQPPQYNDVRLTDAHLDRQWSGYLEPCCK